MPIERLHFHAHRATEHTEDVDEHAAVVDLLVLAIFSDSTIDQEELDALDTFDDEHSDWDSGAFSVRQYLGTSIAKVRAALQTPDGADSFLGDISSRIVTPSLRADSIGYCESMVQLAPEHPGHEAFLGKVRQTLG